jgi:hypothetical protein
MGKQLVNFSFELKDLEYSISLNIAGYLEDLLRAESTSAILRRNVCPNISQQLPSAPTKRALPPDYKILLSIYLVILK